MTKPLPKSLHTVTVLAKLARHLSVDPAEILAALGYSEDADPYGLTAAARKQLK